MHFIYTFLFYLIKLIQQKKNTPFIRCKNQSKTMKKTTRFPISEFQVASIDTSGIELQERSMTRLVKCEFISRGQRLQAAWRKGHKELLSQIGEDLVACELQYHRDCYKNYTRFLSKPSKPFNAGQSG